MRILPAPSPEEAKAVHRLDIWPGIVVDSAPGDSFAALEVLSQLFQADFSKQAQLSRLSCHGV